MAFRSTNRNEYEVMMKLIQEQPGILPTHLARLLGIAPSTVTRRLPRMAEAGHLLYEDEKGGLYPCRNQPTE